MKIWIKVLLGVLGGFGAGFGTGFFVHKKLNDIQFQEVSEEDFDKLLEDLPEDVRLLAAPSKSIDTSANKMEKLSQAMEAAGNDINKLNNALHGKSPYIQADEDKKKEYSKMWNTVKDYSSEENADNIPVEDDDFLESLESDIVEEIAESEQPTKEPYLISLGEFYEDKREYDKITIDWYDQDNVILDEREEPIDDIVGYIGCQVAELFDKPPEDNDPDSRFVRNEKYGTDYEVIRHHANWHELNGE